MLLHLLFELPADVILRREVFLRVLFDILAALGHSHGWLDFALYDEVHWQLLLSALL